MPAEWEHHYATWLAWPNDDDYFEDKIVNIEKIYLEIVKNLHTDELVKILVINKEKEEIITFHMKFQEIKKEKPL